MWWQVPVIPAIWEAEATNYLNPEVAVGRDHTITLQPRQQSKTPSQKQTNKQTNKKISQAWWHAPVIPATREAKAGESLEYRK